MCSQSREQAIKSGLHCHTVIELLAIQPCIHLLCRILPVTVKLDAFDYVLPAGSQKEPYSASLKNNDLQSTMAAWLHLPICVRAKKKKTKQLGGHICVFPEKNQLVALFKKKKKNYLFFPDRV